MYEEFGQRRRFNWSFEEEKYLKKIFSEKQIIKRLNAKKYRKDSIYSIVADELKKVGYERSILQIKQKWQNMKRTYRSIKSSKEVIEDDTNVAFTEIMDCKPSLALLTHGIDTSALNNTANTSMISSESDINQESFESQTLTTEVPFPLEYSKVTLMQKAIANCPNNSEKVDKEAEDALILDQEDPTQVEPSPSTSNQAAGQSSTHCNNRVGLQSILKLPLIREELEKLHKSESKTNRVPPQSVQRKPQDHIWLQQDTSSRVDKSKGRGSYMKALNSFHEKWVASYNIMWKKQETFWKEQSEAQRLWEEKILETQRKHDKDLVMMSNAALMSAVRFLRNSQQALPMECTTSYSPLYVSPETKEPVYKFEPPFSDSSGLSSP